MALAAYNATIKASGVAIVMTGEATTHLIGQLYQVTNTAKRIIDTNTAVVVKDGVSTVAAANYSIDYLAGVVTFVASYTVGGAVTVDGAYLPTYAIAECRATKVSCKQDQADASVFGAAYKQKRGTLSDFTVTLERLAILDTVVVDPDQTVEGWLQDNTALVLEIYFGAAGGKFRGFVVLSGFEVGSAVAGLITENVTAEGAAQAGNCSFSWAA